MAEVLELGLDIKRMLAELDKLQRRFEKEFPAALDKSERAMDEFEEAGTDALRKTSSEAEKFGKAISRLEKRMGGMSQQLKTMASSASFLKSSIMGLAGAAGFAGLTLSVKSFISSGAAYEKQISKLNALTKANEDQMLVLRTAIRDVGAQTTFTAQQAAEAANVLASLGRSSEQVSSELKIMVDVATATSTSIEEVAEVVAAQTNVFGISAKVVGDILAGAYATSAANVQRMAVALRQVGPVAKSVGMDFAETAGSVSILVDRGLEASMAGTALRGILTRLIAPTKAVKESMEKMGVAQEKVAEDSKEAASGLSKVGLSFDKIKNLPLEGKLKAIANGLKNVGDQAERDEMLVKIFGVEALAAANILIDEYSKGNDVISVTAQKLRDVGDAAGMSKKMTDNLAGSLAILESTVSDKILTAFQAVEPLVKSMVDDMIDFVNGITGQDIVDAVRNIGRTLISAGTAFYNVVAGAINGLMRILQGPELSRIIDAAEGAIEYVLGPSPDKAVADQRARISELETQLAESKKFQLLPESISTLGGLIDNPIETALEDARAELKRLEADAKNVQPTKIFESLTEADTSSYLKTFDDGLKKYEERLVKMDAIRAERRQKEAELAKKQEAATAATAVAAVGGTGEAKAGEQTPAEMTEEQKKMWDEVNKAKAELNALTAEENRLLADQAGAHAVLIERMKIEVEQFKKPELLQQQINDNAEKFTEILTGRNSLAEQFTGLQSLQIEIQGQLNAAIKAGFTEQANSLNAQISAAEGLMGSMQTQMVEEAKANIETQKRVEEYEKAVSFMDRLNSISQSNLTYEQQTSQFLNMRQELLDEVAAIEGEISDQQYAQIQSKRAAIRLEEQAALLRENERKAEVEAGKTFWQKGVEGGMRGVGLNAPEGETSRESSAMMSGISGAGPNASRAANIANSGSFQEAGIKLLLSNEKIKASLEKIFAKLFKLIDPFLDLLAPLIDVFGELIDAFKPIAKALMPIARVLRDLTGNVLKGLINVMKPFLHLLSQFLGIFGAIFGGGGGSGGSFGQSIEDVEAALQSVRSALEDLEFSDMNPADSITKLEEATKKYDELRQKAFGDDATTEDIQKFSDFASTYLGLSKEVNKSSSKYVKDFDKVRKDLEGLEGKLVGAGSGEGGIGDFGFDLAKIAEQLAQAIIKAVGKLLEGAISLLAWLAKKVMEVISKALEGTWNLLKALAEAVWKVIETALKGAWNLLSQLATVIWNKITEALKGYMDLNQKLRELLAKKLEEAFRGALNFLQALYNEVVKALQTGFDQAWDFFDALTKEVAGALERGFRQAWNFTKQLVEQVAKALETGFKQAWNFLTQLTREVGKALAKGFDQAFNFFTMLVREVGSALARGFNQAWNFLSMLVNEVKNALAKGFNQPFNFLSQLTGEVVKALQRGFTGAISFIAKLVELTVGKLTSGFQGRVNFIPTLISSAVAKLKEGFSGAIDLIQHLVNVLTSAVTRAFSGTIKMVAHLVNQVTNFITRGFTGTYDFVKVVKDKIFGMLSGGTNLLQQILDKIMKALGLSGQKGKIPILPNPIKFIGGPDNFLELDYSFAQGGSTQYMSGGKAKGPRHKSGMLGMTKAGTPFLFEGQEYIINAKTANLLGEDQLDLLNSMKGPREQAKSAFFQFIQNLTEHGAGVNLASYNAKQAEFAASKYLKLQTSGADGAMELLNINNPLSSLMGPNSWWIKAYFDLLGDPALGIKSNMFGLGGSLGGIIKKVSAPIRQIQKQINNLLFRGGGGGGGRDIIHTPAVPKRKEGTIGNPTVYPDKSLRPKSFSKKGNFKFLGDMVGNDWDLDLINVSNPFTYLVQEIVGWVRKNKLIDLLWKTFVSPIWGWVEKTLGPDRLKVGIDGSMLDFWNSYLDINFGGNVFEELGIERKPENKVKPNGTFKKTFSNGGMVVGPSHSLGGFNAELEGGEYVINKRAAQSFGYANLDQINRSGSLVSRTDAVLEKIAQRLENLSAPQVTVHVYTDMRGEARAEIQKYRYEVKQRAERTKPNTTDRLVPLNAL